jgi:hypothetical protein
LQRPTGVQPIKAKSRKARKEAGVKIVTAHVSGFGSIKDDIEARNCVGAADIILKQEHKFGPQYVENARRWCTKVGYKVGIAQAVIKNKMPHDTPKDKEGSRDKPGWSGGVAIMWRPWLAQVGDPKVVVHGRVISVNLVLTDVGITTIFAVRPNVPGQQGCHKGGCKAHAHPRGPSDSRGRLQCHP